jgi:hypothetical protein
MLDYECSISYSTLKHSSAPRILTTTSVGLFQFSYNPVSVCMSHMAATSRSILQGVERPVISDSIVLLVSWSIQGLAFSPRIGKAKLLSWAEQGLSLRHNCEFWALQESN